MKMVTAILQRLLGFIFLAFGMNGFLHFIPQMPMPPAAIQFFVGLAATGYFLPLLFATQAAAGAMLILGLYVPLALALLAPILVNIFLFHLFLAPGGLPVAVVVLGLELYLVRAYGDAFAPMLRARPEHNAEAVRTTQRTVTA